MTLKQVPKPDSEEVLCEALQGLLEETVMMGLSHSLQAFADVEHLFPNGLIEKCVQRLKRERLFAAKLPAGHIVH